jgi:hypothetical protein
MPSENLQDQRRIYTTGQRVEVNGFEGRVLCEYMPGMWEVRLERGDVCVSWDEVYPLAQS